jgi:Icc-related predicted phosphoesterase
MIALSISDIHGRLGSVGRLAPWLDEADVVILAGDITNFGHADEARAIIRAIQARAKCVLAVSGNCDYPDVVEGLDELCVSLETGPAVVDGVAFLGLGGSLPSPAPTPNVFNETELESALAQSAQKVPEGEPFVLVSHQPPKDSAADRVAGGQHVGSTAVRDFIQVRQPMICFTAHIHESRGVSRIGKTRVVNPGPLGSGHVAVARLEGDRVIECRVQAIT